ncbi:hypothetical protein IAD21_04137 [Abditibacteriota bacterium]|nr:hypothetical protein IAD21_04137 [Abditibacteriota bacterium]
MPLPITRRPLILDLDFTLLHLEYLPGSLEVPGRTRSAWIAPQTVELLAALQTHCAIVLATARSWDGTHWVADGLAERGVNVAGVVLEDGALVGSMDQLSEFDPSFDVTALRARVEAEKTDDWPAFDWQFDFKACLVARCETRDEAAHLSAIFARRYATKSPCRVYRDGRKTYILPRSADKWSALQQLLGEAASEAAGIGDGVNDVVWLPLVAHPATFASAEKHLVEAVLNRGGYVSSLDGHDGIADILRVTGERVAPQNVV